MNRHRWILLLLGSLIVLLLAPIALLGDLGRGDRMRPFLLLWGAAHAAYLAAAWWVLRGPQPRGTSALPIILGAGLLARLCLVPVAPTLSEDVYRYLWDGHLVARGVNPYPHPPTDPVLAPFHGELLHRLNHAEIPTIYPPAAQLLFGAVARLSATPLAWKLSLLAVELALLLALLDLLRRRGLPSERLLLYYWNPLVLVESFGSGHVDLAAAAFLVAAIALYEARRAIPAGISFALAVLTKFVPGLLAPWFLRRRAWALLAGAAVTGAILAAPFRDAGPALTTGLQIYARHWEFNGAAYGILRAAIPPGPDVHSQAAVHAEAVTRSILAAAAIVVILVISLRARSASGAALAVMTAFLLLSPTVFPWYAVPAVALLPLHADLGILAFSGLIALSYVPLPLFRATGLWALPSWVLWVEYGGLVTAWAVAIAVRRARARESGTGVRVEERQDPHVEESEQIEKEER